MKILKVKSLNINSLKGEFEIDFRTFLNDNALFAITGPTGSGKSTILDIITCALYGRTPRLKKPPSEIMSRHTGECYCEVEFEIKGIIYRSSWTQKRARKSADGKFQSAKMELADVESSKVIKSTVTDVPKYVEELSGLDFDRFIQSMMLAQGSFDAFLKAKESDRSTLLEKITGTGIYKQISKEIYDTYILKKRAIEDEELSLGNIDLLEKAVVEKKNQNLETFKVQKKGLDKKEEFSKKTSLWLENLQKLEIDSVKYHEEFELISKEKEDKKEEFMSLELSNKALNVQAIYQEKNLLNQRISKDKQKLELFGKQSIELQELLESKQNQSKLLQDKYSREKISYEQNSIKLKDLREIQSQKRAKQVQTRELDSKLLKQKHNLSIFLSLDIESILEDESLISKEIKKQNLEIKNLKEQSETKEEEYKLLKEKSSNINLNEENIRSQINDIQELTRSIVEYEKILEDINKEKKLLEDINKDISTQNKINEEKTKLLKQIEETLQAKKAIRERELLLKNYESDRAKLKEGEECYLCGSISHPYITHTLEINIDETTKQIQEQEELLSYETTEQKTAQINLAKLNSELESSTLALEKQEQKILSLDEFFLNNKLTLEDNSKLILAKDKQEAQRKLQEIISLRDQKEKLSLEKEKIQKEYADILQIDIKVKNTLKLQEEYKIELKGLNKEIEKLEQKSKTILDIDDIKEYEKTINHNFKSIQDSYNSCEKELAQKNSENDSLNIQVKELKQIQTQNSTELEELNISFEKALKDNSFSSCEEFEKALVSSTKREELTRTCKAIEEKYTRIQTLKTDTTKKLKEQKELNLTDRELEDINTELKELQLNIDELQKSIGSLEKELEINASNIKKHEDKINKLEKKKETFSVWIKLNEMIGSSQGDKFAKFAQGITLDQLISLANNHLSVLSSRYELQRSTEQLLEIEVIDSFQGNTIRPVSTLSGGESFIVSLALALGLSELASQKIAIDSLFLDEGFGTLDEDSLETALNALNLLQSSGKMVGVISHVEALKERIPLQIKVVPKGDGTSELNLN
ncbi:MAG: Exonuclease SbcC [uncultured Campylobacterales bacterium]|uniref:Exonuclease SbcC n=1 Tax=uncultured Campylobacterales bacterium TaxID=352960 RepID=A0A6S6SVQ1_9BACT|nr:MAG: Exonuclease SbcC [uncultured Campylobacterales bacterium]